MSEYLFQAEILLKEFQDIIKSLSTIDFNIMWNLKTYKLNAITANSTSVGLVDIQWLCDVSAHQEKDIIVKFDGVKFHEIIRNHKTCDNKVFICVTSDYIEVYIGDKYEFKLRLLSYEKFDWRGLPELPNEKNIIKNITTKTFVNDILKSKLFHDKEIYFNIKDKECFIGTSSISGESQTKLGICTNFIEDIEAVFYTEQLQNVLSPFKDEALEFIIYTNKICKLTILNEFYAYSIVVANIIKED